MQTLTITNLNIFLEAAWTPKPLKFKNKNSLGVGGPLKLKFANHLSKASLQGTFGTGRLHSELWDWGVKHIADDLFYKTSIFWNWIKTFDSKARLYKQIKHVKCDYTDLLHLIQSFSEGPLT